MRSLSLPGAHVTDAGLKEIAGLTSLEALVLSGTRIGDEGMEVVARSKSLHTLAIDGTRVTDAGLRRLADLRALHTLRCPLDAAGFRALREVNQLHALLIAQGEGGARPGSADRVVTLNLAGSPATDDWLKDITLFTNLQTLHVDSQAVSPANFKHLAPLKSLRTLQLPYWLVNHETLRALAEVKLQHTILGRIGAGNDLLDLSAVKGSDAALKEIVVPGIRALLLNQAPVTDAGLAHLARLPDLQLLHLDGTLITDAGLKHVVGLAGLTELHLKATKVTNAALKDLAALKALHTLSVANTRIDAAGLRDLPALKSLHTLQLSPDQLSDAALAALRASARLHLLWQARTKTGHRPASAAQVITLTLRDAPITDTGLHELGDLTNLEFLDLRGTKVSEQGVEEFKATRPRCALSADGACGTGMRPVRPPG